MTTPVGEGLVGVVLQDLYRVARLIGRGGMGAVYEGTQLRLTKRVAIKVLARELSSNQEALARFRREAEVTSQLGHPHIVHVFDFGTAPSGEPYLVMEFLEGEDLDQRIRRAGRLPLPAAAGIIKQIASALSSTHARGIVHRDLKPANVFLMEVEGENDFVKIVDFGISKVRSASLHLTGESAVMGTPNYMSPEQAAGQVQETDHRTDQWSLACIAYEMLSGRGPFVGESIHSLLYQVVHQDPPRLGSLVKGLPADVEKVVAKGLAKGRGDRFPTINAFSRAFLAAAAGTAAPVDGMSTASSADDKRASPRAISPPIKPSVPQPTTLSRTASELITPLSTLRTRLMSKWTPVVAAAVAAPVLAILLLSKSQTAKAPSPPAPAAMAPRPSMPIVAPMPAPSPPPIAPAPPAPPAEAAPPPEPEHRPPQAVKEKRANTGGRTKQEKDAAATKDKAVGAGSRPPTAQQPPKPPAAPRPSRQTLIEDL